MNRLAANRFADKTIFTPSVTHLHPVYHAHTHTHTYTHIHTVHVALPLRRWAWPTARGEHTLNARARQTGGVVCVRAYPVAGLFCPHSFSLHMDQRRTLGWLRSRRTIAPIPLTYLSTEGGAVAGNEDDWRHLPGTL